MSAEQERAIREDRLHAFRVWTSAPLRRQRPNPVSEDVDVPSLSGGLTNATAAALVMTLGLAAACWVIAVRQMNGMDMGVATRLGSFGFFFAVWMAMMAAMMVRASGTVRDAPLFVTSYLAVWAIAGVAVYALYRPHGTLLAGAVTIGAGVYEFTSLKRYFRRRCRENVRSGLGFGLCCAGSSIGLMAMLVVLGVMSITWMSVITAAGVAQKLLPARVAIDVALGLAILLLGIVIVVSPSSVPGLMPPM
jgi:hypothetical protein